MKELKKEDLKDGEIYRVDTINFGKYVFINKNKLFGCVGINENKLKKHLTFGNYRQNYFKFYETTSEEKHWLEECIKAYKFISYEDVLKTFEFILPEEWCIKVNSENRDILLKFINSKVNTKRVFSKLHKSIYIGKVNNNIPGVLVENNYFCYTSSFYITEITFEQFKKYVLKEKEIMETPKDKVLLIKKLSLKISKVECAEGGIYELGDKITVFTKNSPNKGKVFTITGFRWNNDKTNLCAITELHKPNGIGLDKIELYSEPKATFVLPEKWCVRHHGCVAQYIMKLKKTQSGYSQDLNLFSHFPPFNGRHYCNEFIAHGYKEITIEQFEKYVLNQKEPVKELSLLEQAKLKYPIGTKVRNYNLGKSCEFTINSENYVNDNGDILIRQLSYGLYTVYSKGEWAEIIE